MRGSDQTCTSLELLNFLKQGDYPSFLSSFKAYDFSQTDWFRFQTLAIKVLTYNKSASEALELSKSLSQRLAIPSERELVLAEYLYISWLCNGRNHDDLVGLEELLCRNTQSTRLDAHWEHIRLRTKASKLMLGLMDSGGKEDLLFRYECLVDEFVRQGLVFEAFFALKEVLAFASSKPFPRIGLALNIIDRFLTHPSFDEYDFYTGILLCEKAILTAEHRIWEESDYDVTGLLYQANSKLVKANNTSGVYHYLSEYGSLLLKYGISPGKKMLVRAIRHFQKVNDLGSANSAVNAIMSWQKITGNHTELGGFQYLTSPAKNISIADAKAQEKSLQKEKDMSIRIQSRLAMFQHALGNKDLELAELLLSDLEAKIESIRFSYLTLQVQAAAVLFDIQFGMGSDHQELVAVAQDFQRLGYPQDALEFLTNTLLQQLASCDESLSVSELAGYLNFANDLRSSTRLEMHLIDGVGRLYETLALHYIRLAKHKMALELLKVASTAYSQYGMKPKMAFNYLYQAQVLIVLNRLQVGDSLRKEGLNVLRKSKGLFRLMNLKEGVAIATSNEIRFRKNSAHLSPLHAKPLNTNSGRHHDCYNLNIASVQKGKSSLYELYTDLIESQGKNLAFHHSYSVNLN